MSEISTTRIFYLIAWVIVLPFLAAWPFVSAFPALGLIGRPAFDLATSLNVVFLLTGFWALFSVLLMILWVTRGRVQSACRYDRGLLIGGYSLLWTSLYIIAAIASR